jgi:hypothetical protein
MANWDKSNKACLTLWTSLFQMKQLTTNFEKSGALKMKDLTFFNNLSSSDARRQQAKIIADQLDNVFRAGSGAKYEAGCDRTMAISSMIEVLINEDKQVSDLASAIDSKYKFWGE